MRKMHKMQKAPKPPFWAWRKLCWPCPKLKNPTFGVFFIPPPGGLRQGSRAPLFLQKGGISAWIGASAPFSKGNVGWCAKRGLLGGGTEHAHRAGADKTRTGRVFSTQKVVFSQNALILSLGACKSGPKKGTLGGRLLWTDKSVRRHPKNAKNGPSCDPPARFPKGNADGPRKST